VDERGWQAVAWTVAAVVTVLVGVRVLGSSPEPPPVEIAGERAVGRGRSGARARPAGPYVHVAGAVRRPGLYRLPDGARVAAAVRRAGGAVARADVHAINLAARVQDGQQIVVPSVGAVGVHSSESAGGAGPISLGSATVEQLDELDGIGPTLAQRIVEHRQASGGFASLDQLADVEGIGEKRLAALESALTP
jgi:competence protein ComEA